MREQANRRVGLTEFLQHRRARLHPEQFQLLSFQRRRVPGLRREELAQLVGVSVSWYTWLEQGRDIQVSDQVLDRLAVILRLDAEERRHLFRLAQAPIEELGWKKQEPTATTQAILDGFIFPARLFDERMTAVGWNESANRVFGDYPSRSERERNGPWHLFMNPAARTFHLHWERLARRCLASLHARHDHHPEDTWLNQLIDELQEASPEFRAWWPEHEIVLECGSLFEVHHPQVGQLVLQPTLLPIPSQPGLHMVVYTPLAQEDTATKLKALMADNL